VPASRRTGPDPGILVAETGTGVEGQRGLDVHAYIDPYVDRLKESGPLRDPAVERAFRRVPRHLFVGRFFLTEDEGRTWTTVDHDPADPRPEHLEAIYSGRALVTRRENNRGTSSSSQPGLVADMLQLLKLGPGMRVLEVGAGTGYNAALIAEIVGDPTLVTTIDYQADVADEARAALARAGYGDVRVVHGDGFEGAADGAPFDRIVATVGCPDVSPRWAQQLAPAGSMLIPLRHAGANPLVRVGREDGALVGDVVGFSWFMAVQGALADPSYYAASRAPPALDGEEARPVWPDLVGPRRDFLFYLGVRDARARWFDWARSFRLEEKASGRSARVEAKQLVGDPDLLTELDALYREWRALGAPKLSSFRLAFTPAGEGDGGAPSRPTMGPWTAAGRYYRREFVLRPENPM
jgi:protein-L-isoaspartate(D-aspartate) O-methyltransferase